MGQYGAAYAIQSAIAFRLSQRFYPIPYERRRIALAVGAALLAFFLARLLPPMPAILAVLARGLSVVAVMSVALWLTGFFNADELRWLNALRQQRGRGAPLTTRSRRHRDGRGRS